MSLIPWYWKAGLAALLLAGIGLAAHEYIAHVEAVADKAGYDRSQGEWAKREAGIAEAAQEHAAAETKVAQAETAALQTKFDTLAAQQQKEKANHENDKANAVAAALAGRERLHVTIANPASCAVRNSGDGQGAAAAGPVSSTSSADLLPETAATVLDIAGDYGQLVRDYNFVVDRYNDAARTCNAEPGQAVTASPAAPTQPSGE